MYTQCTKCGANFLISEQQLSQGHGHLVCSQCDSVFDALVKLRAHLGDAVIEEEEATPRLSETDKVSQFDFDLTEELDENPETQWFHTAPLKKSKSHYVFFGLASFVLILTLAGQLLFKFKIDLANDPDSRPWIAQLCTSIGCRLPVFRDTDAIDVLNHQLHDKNDSLALRLNISNTAQLEQPFPDLKLVLKNYIGQPIAAGIFRPSDYLSENRLGLMATDNPENIELKFLSLEQNVASYDFEFVELD